MANKSSKDIQIKDINSWKKGLISYFSKSRLQEDALKAAYNVIYDYDGIVRPRGSFLESGIPDVDEGLVPLGCDFAFKRADKTEGLLNVFSDGTDAHVYVLSPDASSWTKFDTITLDPTLEVSFDQIAGKVAIGNGTDIFTFYDINTNTVSRLQHVDDPLVKPTVTKSNMTGTDAFDFFYRIALTGIGGTTKMSPAEKIESPTLRSSWSSNDSSVTIDISSLTLDADAETWQVWVAQVNTGTGVPTEGEYKLVADQLELTQTQYIDEGDPIILMAKPPVENSTAGIKAKYFKNISGRLWAIDNDGAVWWGGDEGYELYFGSTNGSDSYIVNPESAEQPMAVTLGRDNAGTTCINLLTRTMAGQGAIWDVYATTNSVTFNNQTLSTGTYQFKKREGDDGTDAPFSVVRANNNAYYLSMDGFKSTGVKPNVSGIQSTDIISSAIRDRVLNLKESELGKTYAAYFDESLYWTMAYGSNKNNEIWCYDILHGGIWSIWRIPADAIFRWASSKNESPSLYVRQGHKLLRYYKNSKSHSDHDGAFTSYIESGLIPFGESNLEWVHILKNIWQFDQSIGKVNVTFNLHSKNGAIIASSPVVFGEVADGTLGGWDALVLDDYGVTTGGWDSREWDKVISELANNSGVDGKADQKIRKNAAYASFKIECNTEGTYYELSHLSMLFTYIGVGIEFLNQKGVIKI